MINFCEHSIVTFSLKFVFRGHCITLKSYNQWGGGGVQFGGGGGGPPPPPWRQPEYVVSSSSFFFAVFCKFEIKTLISRSYHELDTSGYINKILEVQNNDNCILRYVQFEP